MRNDEKSRTVSTFALCINTPNTSSLNIRFIFLYSLTLVHCHRVAHIIYIHIYLSIWLAFSFYMQWFVHSLHHLSDCLSVFVSNGLITSHLWVAHFINKYESARFLSFCHKTQLYYTLQLGICSAGSWL